MHIKISSLATSATVILATFCAACDGNFVKMTFPLQWYIETPPCNLSKYTWKYLRASMALTNLIRATVSEVMPAHSCILAQHPQNRYAGQTSVWNIWAIIRDFLVLVRDAPASSVTSFWYLVNYICQSIRAHLSDWGEILIAGSLYSRWVWIRHIKRGAHRLSGCLTYVCKSPISSDVHSIGVQWQDW